MAPSAMVFKMIVDASITIGNIIEISVISGGGIMTLAVLKNTVNNMKSDISEMKAEMKKFGEVLVTMAVTSQRIANAEQDIRDLKHGRGFVLNEPAQEYR